MDYETEIKGAKERLKAAYEALQGPWVAHREAKLSLRYAQEKYLSDLKTTFVSDEQAAKRSLFDSLYSELYLELTDYAPDWNDWESKTFLESIEDSEYILGEVRWSQRV